MEDLFQIKYELILTNIIGIDDKTLTDEDFKIPNIWSISSTQFITPSQLEDVQSLVTVEPEIKLSEKPFKMTGELTTYIEWTFMINHYMEREKDSWFLFNKLDLMQVAGFYDSEAWLSRCLLEVACEAKEEIEKIVKLLKD